jgi:transposase InsO family protein
MGHLRWIEEYNEGYLHSALGYKTPNQMEETYNLSHKTLLETAC